MVVFTSESASVLYGRNATHSSECYSRICQAGLQSLQVPGESPLAVDGPSVHLFAHLYRFEPSCPGSCSDESPDRPLQRWLNSWTRRFESHRHNSVDRSAGMDPAAVCRCLRKLPFRAHRELTKKVFPKGEWNTPLGACPAQWRRILRTSHPKSTSRPAFRPSRTIRYPGDCRSLPPRYDSEPGRWVDFDSRRKL